MDVQDRKQWGIPFLLFHRSDCSVHHSPGASLAYNIIPMCNSLQHYSISIAFQPHCQVFAYSMFVSTMAFHAKVSDPTIGGTYMTLLNTITNLAGTWISTLALWLVDNVSFKDCEGVTDLSLDCDTMQELKVRRKS